MSRSQTEPNLSPSYRELLAVCADRDRMVDEIVRLRKAIADARDLLARDQPYSLADNSGDAWEAWAVLETALSW